ncbi:MAG: hypothetical protein QOI56_1657 [Actinomycetota bacterium]|nr:hypothetical protein [Actinomycetota bacterium]
MGVANLVPGQYRKVSVATVDVPLTREHLTAHFLGREVYRHTRFVVVRGRGGGTAVVEVGHGDAHHRDTGALFTSVEAVEVLALPAECADVVAPDADTGIPSALGAVARDRAPGARCVVVEGRYRHVSFIVDPRPVRIRVGDVVPPAPAKLIDQARRVLDVAEDLPPVELVPEVVDLGDLARGHPAERYLLPCQGSGFELDGAAVEFLDQHPGRRPWILLGCARSRAIHQWFYGDVPDTVDTCPRRMFAGSADEPLLTKCCLLEDGNADEAGVVAVPWGASLELVGQALARLATAAAPDWAPA